VLAYAYGEKRQGRMWYDLYTVFACYFNSDQNSIDDLYIESNHLVADDNKWLRHSTDDVIWEV